MKSKLMAKGDLSRFLEDLMKDHVVYGPKRKRGEHQFGRITDTKDLDLSYTTTILPPKHLLIPTQEPLLSFTQDGRPKPVEHEYAKQLIFGMHSCDVSGIMLLDHVFQGEYPLPRYVEQRKNTTVVALTCTNVGDTCFCDSMGTGPCPTGGFDVLLTDLGEKYLIETGTREGEQLAARISGPDADKTSLEMKDSIIVETRKKFKKRIDMEGLPELFQSKLNHPIWKRLEQIDLACANCVMSCPTCFCFDIYDQWADIGKTVRCIEWDACFLLEFGQVALGGNFRKNRADRIRQFMGHNLSWGGASQFNNSPIKHKCVGCGRCIKACPVHIDITEIAKEIRKEQ